MPTIRIDEDELYPYWFVASDAHPDFGTTIEVDRETLARWKDVLEEFEQVQIEMRNAVNDAK